MAKVTANQPLRLSDNKEAVERALAVAPQLPGNPPGAIPAADGKAEYDITGLAPPRIAGQRIAEGQTTIRLSEEQARAELLAGHIRPHGLPPRQPGSAAAPAEQPAAGSAG